MSGTSPEESLQERADHEAGHCVIGHVLGRGKVPFYHHWITLETRASSGGSNGFQSLEALPFPEYAQFCLAGMYAQIHGREMRDGISRSERGENGLDAISEQVLSDGGMDLADVQMLQGFTLSALAASARQSRDLVRKYWSDITELSKELRAPALNLTMFGQEAEFFLKSLTHYPSWVILDMYRQTRQAVTPPAEWLKNSSVAHPAGPFFEGIDAWLARDAEPES